MTRTIHTHLAATVRLLMLFCCLFAGFAHAQSASAAAASANTTAAGGAVVAGTVELVDGDVTVYDSKKKPRKPAVGDKVHEGDSVVTGADGELHLAMEDTGFLAVRPNTRMRIIKYRAQGDEQDQGVIGLLVGSLRSITGWIGKYQPRAYAIRTPTATVGIRGTDHEPMVIPEGSSEGEAGTYDKVNIGGSYIKTAHGEVEVPAQRAAFAPFHGKPGTRPRLLDGVPRFFRQTRHERLIEKRHEIIQNLIQQRREERRRLIQERIKLRQQALRDDRAQRQNGDGQPEAAQQRRQLQDERREKLQQREERGERLQERREQRMEQLQRRREERDERAQRRDGDGPRHPNRRDD